MDSYRRFQDRMLEIETLISLVPNRPLSSNMGKLNALTRAALVLLCSHLEGFLQDLLKEFADELQGKRIKFHDLPLEVYIQNAFPEGKLPQQGNAGLIKTFTKFRDHSLTNEVIKIEKKRFGDTESNPKAEVINKLFRVIGEEEILDQLNEEYLRIPVIAERTPFLREDEKYDLLSILNDQVLVQKLDRYLTEKRIAPTKKHARGRKLGFYLTLDELLDNRNQIAHGNYEKKISKATLVRLKGEVSVLAYALMHAVKKRLEEIVLQTV